MGTSDLDQFVQSEQRDVGAISSPAQRAGRIARATIQTPLVAAAGALPDVRDLARSAGSAVKGAGSAISDFARGMSGSTTPAPAAPATPAPSAPATTSGGGDYTSTMSPDEQKVAVASVAPAAATSAASAPATGAGYADAPARPSNVRAYLRTPSAPSAPTVDPGEFADNVVTMKNVQPGASVGQAADANVNANTYAKNYLLALKGAQEGYTGETGRITSIANANLSGAHAEEAGARTADTQAGSALKRYSLTQQQNLQELTKKLADPNLKPEERRNLEMQLWILHGKPPRPDNRYQAVDGKFNPMTGTFEPSVVLDRSTGTVQGLDKTAGAKPPPSDPQAEARAAIAAGADRAKVNQRLRTMGQAEIQ